MNTPVLALAGGVGGAKLALGLTKVLEPNDLTVVVNTGDDEEFYGLHVSPDLDTVMYTLAGVSNKEMGWGLEGETFQALERLKAYGEDAWFGLGDKDLATHIRRTHMLREGSTLSDVTESLSTALGVRHPIVPMTNDPVRTIVRTDEGELAFQVYFVKMRCEPAVNGLEFRGAESAIPSPRFKDALATAKTLVFCPSNPFLSVAPILEVRGVRDAIETFKGPRIVVSPIVGGQAIKGPAAKMLEELGHNVSSIGVARQYRDLCDIFVIDEQDRKLTTAIESLGMKVEVTDTIMNTDDDKQRLAQFIMELVG